MVDDHVKMVVAVPNIILPFIHELEENIKFWESFNKSDERLM